MMKQTVTLLGTKRSQGMLDNGTRYDSTKIYVQVPMDINNPDMAGYSVNEYNWGDNTNFNKISNLPFPVQAEITLEMVSNGKTMKMIVTDVQPIQDLKTKDKA